MESPIRGSLLLLLLIIFSSTLLQAKVQYDFVVAQDGSGDFTCVQDAIDAVPDFRKSVTTILIKKGVYKEKLVLPGSKQRVKLVGENVNTTFLTYDDWAQKKNRFGEEKGTSGSASFYIYGDHFSAENISFQNTAGSVGQAVAVWVAGDKVAFRNCRFLGFQDTLYTYGKGSASRQYYKDCYIEGTVDFIFGSSTALFEDCRIFCKKQGYITAASTPDTSAYGYVFKNCTITGNAADESFYLGRPWRPYAKVVFMHCKLGKMIRPEGWDNWRNESNEKTAYYAEFDNKGKGYQPNRRVPWSHQLSKAEAAKYSADLILSGWRPFQE